MNKIYLIHGIIFQEGIVFGVTQEPIIGAIAVMQKKIVSAMFQGVISSNGNENELVGSMNDKWGPSLITNFEVTDKNLNFTKHYENRPPIQYEFVKIYDEYWHGQYSGQDSGTGASRLILNEVSPSFFKP